MAKLVTKFKYLKPNKKAKGGYARYIATRDGVEMIDDSQIVPSPKKQTKNAGEKPNEKNDKYGIKLLYCTAFIPRFT